MPHSVIDEISTQDTFRALNEQQSTALVDVRTVAEWAYVGLPDISATGRPLWMVEWVRLGAQSPDPAFVDRLLAEAGGTLPERLFFICRSGIRSMAAARAVATAMDQAEKPVHCTNVAKGFEGDLDQHRHRGSINGWKVDGLPWAQN